jgi:hypothetical protein
VAKGVLALHKTLKLNTEMEPGDAAEASAPSIRTGAGRARKHSFARLAVWLSGAKIIVKNTFQQPVLSNWKWDVPAHKKTSWDYSEFYYCFHLKIQTASANTK